MPPQFSQPTPSLRILPSSPHVLTQRVTVDKPACLKNIVLNPQGLLSIPTIGTVEVKCVRVRVCEDGNPAP